MHAARTGRAAELAGYEVSERTIERYRAFRESLAASGRDVEHAREALRPSFGDTFFYYEVFGPDPRLYGGGSRASGKP